MANGIRGRLASVSSCSDAHCHIEPQRGRRGVPHCAPAPRRHIPPLQLQLPLEHLCTLQPSAHAQVPHLFPLLFVENELVMRVSVSDTVMQNWTTANGAGGSQLQNRLSAPRVRRLLLHEHQFRFRLGQRATITSAPPPVTHQCGPVSEHESLVRCTTMSPVHLATETPFGGINVVFVSSELIFKWENGCIPEVAGRDAVSGT